MALPSFFEFHDFTDIRWDKDAKIQEPEHAESIIPFILKGIEDNKKTDIHSPASVDLTNF